MNKKLKVISTLKSGTTLTSYMEQEQLNRFVDAYQESVHESKPNTCSWLGTDNNITIVSLLEIAAIVVYDEEV